MSNEELKKTFEDKCRECSENYLRNNPGKNFPYNRCKRCDIGRQAHELDNKGWVCDSVKRDC